jgi:dolichyl-phosphate-mannose--protein O-mannosyl transferase
MGPWQFWTGLRQRNLAIHRWTGRLFLLGVAMGVIGSIGLIATTTFGWAFATGIAGLASAWLVTTSMAYYSIRKGLVALHKEWMIRAYVVTFAFVTFRILSDYGPTSRLMPESDRSITIAWACWVVPLAVTEMIFHLKRVQAAVAARR